MKGKSVYSKKKILKLKKLGKNENIHLTKPDKGRGIVILDEEDGTVVF